MTTRFLYDGTDLIGEYNGSNTLVRRYVHGPGSDEALVWYEGSGTTDRRWLHADERGSVIAISDGSGAVLGINRYDEYGIPQATNLGRFGYTGQAWLPEIGMNYYKARIYSPTLGRFMQTDPIGYQAGMNLYNYVDSDPVNATDPSGLSSRQPDILPICWPGDICVNGEREPLPGLDHPALLGAFRSDLPSTPQIDPEEQEPIVVTCDAKCQAKSKEKSLICRLLSNLPSGDSLSLGADVQAYGGIGGFLGLSGFIDRDGNVGVNFTRGWGAGFGGNGGFSLNYGNTPSPGRTGVSHIQGGAGFGYIGGSASYSKAEGWNRSGGISVGPRIGFTFGSVDGISSTAAIANICK